MIGSTSISMKKKKSTINQSDGNFINTIFNWSLPDILNKDLYKTKVDSIGLSFDSAGKYFQSFLYPLLNETRTELCSCMEVLSTLPYAKVVTLNRLKSPLFGRSLYEVTTDNWKNRSLGHGKELYKTSPSDLFILVDFKPETVNDLQRDGSIRSFALSAQVLNEENDNDTELKSNFKFIASKDIDIDGMGQKSLFIIFLTNITPIRRMWISLHMDGNSKLIQKILCASDAVEENCDHCPPKTDAFKDHEAYNKLLSEFNESQKKEIGACLSSIGCNHKSTVDLICSSPGTEKTKILVTLLCALFKMNRRTLVCAPSTVAIKEVASGGLSMVRQLFQFCYLGDMLLFGNHEQLNVGEEIQEIYLDYRVKQLMSCFNPSNGWKYCFTSMIHFLENCFTHYQMSILNQKTKEQVQTNDNNSNTAKDDSLSDSDVRTHQSFVEFFIEKFQAIALPLKKYIHILRTHIARSFIMEHNLDVLADLNVSLDSFEALVSDGNIVSERLEELFYPLETRDSSSESDVVSADERSFLENITKCISLLKSLQVSLGKQKLPDIVTEKSIREFCLQTASLMLSTASDSFMLHSLDIKPLDIVVIDEAAQLKECESIIPLLLPEINHAVLIGDEHQQPSIVSLEADFGRSLFHRLRLQGRHPNHLLNEQHRMHYIKDVNLPFQISDEQNDIILSERSSFVLGRSGTGKTTILTAKLLKREKAPFFRADQEEEAACLRQMFITMSPKLCHHVIYKLKRFRCGESKFFEDETAAYESSLAQFENVPDSLVGLSVDSYPLVLTFRKFLMMFDGSVGGVSFFERFNDLFAGDALKENIWDREVTFERFDLSYWSTFNYGDKKNLNSSRVFAEIMSYIKGGMDTMGTNLSQDAYLALSENQGSSLSKKQRKIIYHIYQQYEKMKILRREFDLADIVADIHLRLKSNIYEGDAMHYVYMDEVQDFTLSQIALLKHICQNVEEGFTFCGDTAQTITKGVYFRFQDIKSFFYSTFHNGTNPVKTKTLQLTQNFRSHDGVLKLSHTAINLLYHFFPDSIDILKPETSLLCGEAPAVLDCGNSKDAIATIFGKSVGFGAEQVILVRDDSARKEILASVKEKAIVLTIWECKGLEFKDVFLYNFFGSSPLKDDWRVIKGYKEKQDALEPTETSSFPTYKDPKHNILCSELKQLYVAITRTRDRLWICESPSTESHAKPMFEFWKTRDLIQVKKLDDSFIQSMTVASNPKEWRARGMELYNHKIYEMATVCFQRAGDNSWEEKSKAAGDRVKSNSSSSEPKEENVVPREAQDIGMAESSAQCLVDLEDHERAGDSKKRFDKETYCLGGYLPPDAEMGPMMKWVQETHFYDCRELPKGTVGFGNQIATHAKLSPHGKTQAKAMQQLVDNLLPIVALLKQPFCPKNKHYCNSMKILKENSIGRKFLNSFTESLPQKGYDDFYSAFEDLEEKLVHLTDTTMLGFLLDQMLMDTMAWSGVVVSTKMNLVGWICSKEPNYFHMLAQSSHPPLKLMWVCDLLERLVIKFFNPNDHSRHKFLTILLLHVFFKKDSKLVQKEKGKELPFDDYFKENSILAADMNSEVIILKLRENSLILPPMEHVVSVDMTSCPTPTIEKILEEIYPEAVKEVAEKAAEESTKKVAKESEIHKGKEKKNKSNSKKKGNGSTEWLDVFARFNRRVITGWLEHC